MDIDFGLMEQNLHVLSISIKNCPITFNSIKQQILLIDTRNLRSVSVLSWEKAGLTENTHTHTRDGTTGAVPLKGL